METTYSFSYTRGPEGFYGDGGDFSQERHELERWVELKHQQRNRVSGRTWEPKVAISSPIVQNAALVPFNAKTTRRAGLKTHIRSGFLSIFVSPAVFNRARSVSNSVLESPRVYWMMKHLAARLRSPRPGSGYMSLPHTTLSKVSSTETCVDFS